jgi:hypothetical protein
MNALPRAKPSAKLSSIQNPKFKIPHHGERIGLIKPDAEAIEMHWLAFTRIPCSFIL